jgi:DNA-binding CsgD family transcriptional regulator
MSSSDEPAEPIPLSPLLHSGSWWPAYRDALRQLNDASDDTGVIRALEQAVRSFGASGAVFSHLVRHDASFTVVRTLVACDAPWTHAYTSDAWFDDDVWLQHATQHATTVLASDIAPTTARQATIESTLAAQGFASAIVAPAPSNVGRSRIGVLCVGSAQPGYFDGDALALLRPVVRGLAMELSDWWLRQIRANLMVQAQLTADDLDLLRYEAHGHSSKVIGRMLNADIGAIDSRFQRLSRRLGVAGRRDAMRLGRLYGLI